MIMCTLSSGFFWDSWKVFLAIALLLKISMVSSVAEDYYNPDYTEDEALNPNNWGGIFPENPVKRHVGAVAKSSSRTPRANDMGPPAWGLIFPENPTKRHVGAVAKSSSRAFHGNEMGTPSKGFSTFGRVVKSEWTDPPVEFGSSNDFNVKQFLENNRRPLTDDFLAGTEAEIVDATSLDHQEMNPNSSPLQFTQAESGAKEKRFLGTLVRGGWFPRQFRGVVEPQQWDKRHIGAAARVGWMPYRMNNRKNDAIGYKRNIGSLRRKSKESSLQGKK